MSKKKLTQILLYVCYDDFLKFWFMVFNTTFNNISAISWRSVSLVEETGVPGKKTPTCRKSLTSFII